MFPLESLLTRQLDSGDSTSNRTLRPEDDAPTTAHVSPSLMRQVKSLKNGVMVSPSG